MSVASRNRHFLLPTSNTWHMLTLKIIPTFLIREVVINTKIIPHLIAPRFSRLSVTSLLFRLQNHGNRTFAGYQLNIEDIAGLAQQWV